MKKYFFLLASGDPKVGSAVEEMIKDHNGSKYAILVQDSKTQAVSLSLVTNEGPVMPSALVRFHSHNNDDLCAVLDLDRLFEMDYDECMLFNNFGDVGA